MRFYVYALFEGEAIFYIGKGSGTRLKSQQSRFKLCGKILEECHTEDKAFARERYWIDKLKPVHNISRGGNGGRVKTYKRLPRRTKEDILIEHIGTRVYAARVLLSKIDERNCNKYGILPSQVSGWREIAQMKSII